MAFVIAEPCIGTKDTACVDVCPVDCIHPKKNATYDDDRPGFDEVLQMYIDPVECIDCGACVPVCPVGGDFRAGRPTRKVEALHGTKRELHPGRQVHTRRVRQAQRSEVGARKSQIIQRAFEAFRRLDDPLCRVVLGTGKMLDDFKLLRRLSIESMAA
jgi:NAD-dependent dihydropyrimidine dehydrogenase PreA subunit